MARRTFCAELIDITRRTMPRTIFGFSVTCPLQRSRLKDTVSDRILTAVEWFSRRRRAPEGREIPPPVQKDYIDQDSRQNNRLLCVHAIFALSPRFKKKPHYRLLLPASGVPHNLFMVLSDRGTPYARRATHAYRRYTGHKGFTCIAFGIDILVRCFHAPIHFILFL